MTTASTSSPAIFSRILLQISENYEKRRFLQKTFFGEKKKTPAAFRLGILPEFSIINIIINTLINN